MKLFRLSTLTMISGAVAAGALLFWTSQSVQQSEDQLSRLKKGVQTETQAIRVLNAEWDYLNRPDRLETLAIEHLGLSSAAAFNVSGDASALPDVFMPVMPQIKPVSERVPEAQPIALQSVQGVPVPRAKPKNGDTQSFRSLLNDLSHDGGAP